jgi:hypothetical protein
MLFFSISMFTVGSLISCRANNFTTLLAGRSVKGIGGGGIIALNLVIITDVIPLRHRPKYYAFTQIAWALGTITGPLVGGAIAEYSNWRVLFYINFPFCAFGLVAILWTKQVGNPGDWSVRNFLKRVDWVGNLLFMTGSTCFLIGITWAGEQYAWSSYQTLIPLLAGLALVVSSLFWEEFFASTPFIRRTMLHSRPLMTTYACTLVAGFLLYANLYYVALFMMSVQARTALNTGVVLLPIFLGFMPASGLVSAAIQRWGTWKWSLWLGWGLNTLGAGLFILLDKDTAVVAFVFIFLVIGSGQGALISAHNLGVQAIANIEDVAWASALFTFMRSVGLCLGVALGGTILQSQLRRELEKRFLPTTIADHAESFIFELMKLPEDYPGRAAIVASFSSSFRFLFIILTCVSGAAFILCFTVTGHHSLDKEDASAAASDIEASPSLDTTREPKYLNGSAQA